MPKHDQDQTPFPDLPNQIHHIVEQAEEGILRTNYAIARMGATGILADHMLLGPVMGFRPALPKVRHFFGPKMNRSAVDPHRGLGVLVIDADIVPFPRLSESWDLVEAHEDDRFVPFESCVLAHKATLVDRHMAHLRHLMSVMKDLILGKPHQPKPFEEYAMEEEQPFPAKVSSEEHANALDDFLQLLARLLAKRHLGNRPAGDEGNNPDTGKD